MLQLFRRRPSPRNAEAELRAELQGFAYDGLVQLEADLEAGAVQLGTWDGCVLSYRRGYAGSVDCDRNGRRGNVFTRFWDGEVITPGRVLELVRAEIATRDVPAPAPAVVVTHKPVSVDVPREEVEEMVNRLFTEIRAQLESGRVGY